MLALRALHRLARQASLARLLALALLAVPGATVLALAGARGPALSLGACPVISGYVYYDVNDNGRMDAGEPGLSGVPMQLKDAAGATVALTSTGPTGSYAFERPLSSSTASLTQAYTATFPGAGTDWRAEEAIPKFDPSLGALESVTITVDAEITSSFRAENLDPEAQPLAAEVSGAISLTAPGISITAAPLLGAGDFAADAFDGALDFAGPSGHDFGSVTATDSATGAISEAAALAAYTGTGTVAFQAAAISSSRVSAGGNIADDVHTVASAEATITYTYRPADCLADGIYTVVEVAQPTAYGDGFETAGNNGPLPGTKGSDAIAVTLAGQDSAQNNFGELAASLQGCVYVDANENGLLDSGEPGIPGVTITLGGADSSTQQTASDGCYLFSNLRPGVYSITEAQPAGLADCRDAIGSQGGATGNDLLSNIRLPANVQGRNNNFGECRPATATPTLSPTPSATPTATGAPEPPPSGSAPVVASQATIEGSSTTAPSAVPTGSAATGATPAAPQAPDAGSGFFDRTPDVRFVILGFAIFAASGWIAFLALGRARDQRDD